MKSQKEEEGKLQSSLEPQNGKKSQEKEMGAKECANHPREPALFDRKVCVLLLLHKGEKQSTKQKMGIIAIRDGS